MILTELATLYREQGQCQQAEPLYQRALAICKQRLGADHPLMATILHGLATLPASRKTREHE
ncbi:MAG: tetratricopeptide repeat protein [Ktedonobacteraceae bacterium]|nr:tetratricopeptide repeat protein [Ktedonobacteraceae bacterium]